MHQPLLARQCVKVAFGPIQTFSNAFRAKVVRIARKEFKPERQWTRKAITGHRLEIAALKREVKALATQLKATQRHVKETVTRKAEVLAEMATPKKSKQIQIHPQAPIEKRAALGLTQSQLAQLLGASSLSVCKWETGHVHPRAAQLESITEVLKVGMRKAQALLNPE